VEEGHAATIGMGGEQAGTTVVTTRWQAATEGVDVILTTWGCDARPPDTAPSSRRPAIRHPVLRTSVRAGSYAILYRNRSQYPASASVEACVIVPGGAFR
jgi:hypothetical protein